MMTFWTFSLISDLKEVNIFLKNHEHFLNEIFQDIQ
jgi:hypothetical protein